MQKWWSYLFGFVAALAFLLFPISALMGWWLPRNVSVFGGDVDKLYYLILGITGFFFVLTEALLVYFMYIYAGRPGAEPYVFGHHYAEKKVWWTSFFKQVAKPVTAVLHNQHRVEVFWTLVPAGILLYIALAQISTWAWIKYNSSMPRPGQDVQQIEVTARQFEWQVRYPSLNRTDPKRFALQNQADDVYVLNEVHTWKNQRVLVHLRTRDVIHSFYLPNLRLKQDALPGKVIPVWFEATAANTRYDEAAGRWVDGYDPDTKETNKQSQVWELACAELCGWGHYKMLGRLYVHENKADFEAWLRSASQAQNAVQLPATAGQ